MLSVRDAEVNTSLGRFLRICLCLSSKGLPRQSLNLEGISIGANSK